MFLEKFKIIDLTHPISPQIPTWNGSCGFCLEIKKDYDQMFRVQKIKMHAGVGTHMDAPSHRIEGGLSIADISLDSLIVPICVIDVASTSHKDYEISTSDIEKYEMKYGGIPQNSLVVGYTGWSRFWSNPDAYRNVDANGQMHFPAFSKEAAEFLLKRGIAGIGIDTLSPDCLDPTFSVHKLILGAGKYIIENIADCSELPAAGGIGMAFPLRAEETTEAPVRLVCLAPQHAAAPS